jgi:cephalosporin-C deacetylase-like acetyl esterase/S-formylglutathione hydrolase FrmB
MVGQNMRRLRGAALTATIAAAAMTAVLGQVKTNVPDPVAGAQSVAVEPIKIHGTALEGNLEGNAVDRDVIVFLPPSYPREPTRRYPVVYALHGYSIGAKQWSAEIHVPQTVEGAFAKGAKEMIVVLPDSKTVHNGSMYSSSVTTGDFETFIARDVVQYIDAHYRTIPNRNARGLVGHSMGGYGASRIGMKHADVFGSLYVMSPCCLSPRSAAPGNTANEEALAAVKTPADSEKLPFGLRAQLASAAAWSPNPNNPPLYLDLPIGANQQAVLARWTANAPLAFIDQYVPQLRQYRAIAIDVGDMDNLKVDTARLHDVLTAYGIKHDFEIYPGTHTSNVAVRFQENVLPFFSRTLSFETSAPQPPPRARIAQQLTFTPYHADDIYRVGETVGWTVTPGPAPPTYSYKWTIRRNNAVVLREGKLDLSSGKAAIEIVADQPGMMYVAIEAYADVSSPPADAPRFTGGNTGRNTGFYAVGAAVAPTKIGLSTPRPADFDAFWEGKLAAQATIPINPVLTPVATDVPGVEMSMFQLDALGSKVHGYVAKPAKDGRFPAVIQLQYAGVYALNAGAVARRASEGWLIVNVDSHDKLPSDPSGNVPRGYQAIGNTDRETSYFLNMYLRDSRALDYLMSRPDWDGQTIVLIGGSMGGQQSLAVAGLRPEKISAVLVCVPAGADTNGDLHGRKAGYPNWASDNPEVMRAALYFDTVNFASRIKAPVLAGMGFIDTISPPAGVWTMINQVPGPVEALPMIESEHDNLTPEKGRACPARTSEILDLMVRGGRFTARVLQ